MSDEERDDQDESESPEERLFDRQEAERLLPELGNLLSDAREKKGRAESIEREFGQIQNRILLYGGIIPPHAQLAERKLERDSLVTAIRQRISEVESNGCVVKDLDQGLVDFPSIVNGEQVYLCWKLGEEHILYWHRTDEGFAGRKPLERGRDASGESPKPN